MISSKAPLAWQWSKSHEVLCGSVAEGWDYRSQSDHILPGNHRMSHPKCSSEDLHDGHDVGEER